MHAFLLSGQDENFIANLPGKKIEFPFEKIGDVRNLASFTNLKLTEKTVIVLKNIDKATEEAQNAFLKALEEPQENLTYVLLAHNRDRVLPTIVSRCEVIEIPNYKSVISKEEKNKINEFVDADIGKKLKITSQITKREEALGFANNLIKTSHKLFLGKPALANFLEEALKLKRNLELNGNVSLSLTNFIIALT